MSIATRFRQMTAQMRTARALSVCLHTLLAFGLVSATAMAQTGTPTSWNLRIYAAGGATAQSTVSVTTAQVQCGQVKATGSTTNPTIWRWDDPADAAKDCVFSDATRLTALADGSYEGTAQAVNADGSSAESARSPFTRRRPNPPAVPTGVRVSQ